MRNMFTMMNNARLSVGLQGLSIAERAYQKAPGNTHMERLAGPRRSVPSREPRARSSTTPTCAAC